MPRRSITKEVVMRSLFIRFLRVVLQTAHPCQILFILSGLIFPALASASTHTASGTFAWNTTTGVLTTNWTSSDFTCGGPSIGTDIQAGVIITATTMTIPSKNITWTRSSGTAGNGAGTWTATDSATGNSYTLTINTNGTLSLTGLIVRCGGGGGQNQNPAARSQHWPSGYYVQLEYVDSPKTAAAVSVAGAGITGSETLTYNAAQGSWNSWTSPSSQVFFGSAYPALPYTYTFTISPSTGTPTTATSTVSCFQQQLVTNVYPAGSVMGTPTFSWTGINDTNATYAVQLNDNNNRLWDSNSVSGTSVVYNGPALTPGKTYSYDVVVLSSSACSNGQSFAQGGFTYGAAADVSYAGTYTGNYYATVVGEWTMTISSTGTVTGTGTATCNNSCIPSGYYPLSGSVSANGNITFTTSGGDVCSGTITASTGAVSGTCIWAGGPNPGSRGSFSGTKQTQTLSPQTIGAISFSTATIAVGGTITASAIATSGLAVSFSSTTPTICTVSGNTVTGVAPGTCIVAADQAGNASYSAAPQITQSIADVLPVLTLSKSGTGSGTVTSADGSINCGSTCSATYNSVTSVTLTAAPASGSTFTGWDGACTGTGICTLNVDAVKNVAASFNLIPFTAVITGVTAGIITAPVATVTATISFNPADVGKPENVFVTAWVPSSVFGVAQQAKVASYTTLVKPLGTTSTFILAQLTPSGWQPVVNGQLIPYVSGVLSEQVAAISILNNTSTANLLGSQICVGYGTSQADMTSAGRMQLVATIPNPNATSIHTGSCNVALPISNTRAFAYAESNYATLFAGPPTADQIDYQGHHYDYRYYPFTQNYLAVDPAGVVWILGPVSNNVIASVGPVESFRSVITTWEGTVSAK